MAAEQKLINFELVSPEARLFAEPVYMAVIPAAEGQMGVGAGHESYVVALNPGVVELFTSKGASSQKIFVAGGFADVTAEHCVVLAEQAIMVSDLNAADIEREISHLREDLGLAKDQVERARVERKLALAQARLQAATRRAA